MILNYSSPLLLILMLWASSDALNPARLQAAIQRAAVAKDPIQEQIAIKVADVLTQALWEVEMGYIEEDSPYEDTLNYGAIHREEVGEGSIVCWLTRYQAPPYSKNFYREKDRPRLVRIVSANNLYSEAGSVSLSCDVDPDQQSAFQAHPTLLEDDEDEAPISSLETPSRPLCRRTAPGKRYPPCPFFIHLVIKDIPQLTSLSFLKHSALTNLDQFPQFSLFQLCLFSLEITNCGLTIFAPEELAGFDRLTDIVLKNNNVETLLPSPTPVLPLLYSLDLSHNNIKILGKFFHPPAFASLHALSLANNHLATLPDHCLSGLGQLQYLSLARNLLRNHAIAPQSFAGIGEQIGAMNALVLDLSDNAFTGPVLFEEKLRQQLTHLFLLRNPICGLSQAEREALPSYYCLKGEEIFRHSLRVAPPLTAIYGHAYGV